jgi:hypothetical protein
VSVLLGYGNGSFANQLTYSTGSSPYSVAIGDFNNDNREDIVVANYHSDNVSVLLGYGNGSFANQLTYSTGSSPISVAVGDFNNDTRLDVVTANRNGNTVSVLFGYGNGTFTNQMVYSVQSQPYFVAVGDFNNDIRLDIVVVNSASNTVSVLLGHGDGSFANQMTYLVGSSPYAVAVGDMNGDNRLDIVAVNYISNDLSVLLGYGNGSFANQLTHFTGSYSRSIVIADFNNDTRLDIVILNLGSNDAVILFGCSNELFIIQTTLTAGMGSRPQSLVIGDFNNDDRMDIGVANSGTHTIGIFLGYNNISFANQVTYSTGSYSSPYSIAAGHFNNDTQLDIVVANYNSDNVGVFLGHTDGSFRNQTTYSTGGSSSPYYVAVGFFNNDTILDIIVANYGTNNVGIFVGHGNDTFARMVSFPMDYGSRPFSVVTGNFNNDTKLDFAVANGGTDSLSVLLQTC